MIQSNYLPWRGYFDFIDDVDLFVIYDDVQYTRKDWRNRNKIKTNKGTQWLTVPVHYSLSNPALIMHAEISYDEAWQRKHVGNILQWYKSAPYFNHYSDELFNQINGHNLTISELNISLIRWVMKILKISTPIIHSSEITSTGDRNERIIDILKQLNCSTYLLGPAAKDYVNEDAYRKENIELHYKTYDYLSYPQLQGDFNGAVSIIDLLFNCGPESRVLMKSQKPNIRAV